VNKAQEENPKKKWNRRSDKEHMSQTQKQKGEGWKRNQMLKWRKGWKHQHANAYKRRAKKQHFDNQEKIYSNGDNLSMDLNKHQNGNNLSMDF
jgi:hypothetical protein